MKSLSVDVRSELCDCSDSQRGSKNHSCIHVNHERKKRKRDRFKRGNVCIMAGAPLNCICVCVCVVTLWCNFVCVCSCASQSKLSVCVRNMWLLICMAVNGDFCFATVCQVTNTMRPLSWVGPLATDTEMYSKRERESQAGGKKAGEGGWEREGYLRTKSGRKRGI